MQYKTPSASLASASETAVVAPISIPASPVDLLTAFSCIPDPRRRQGTRFPLPAVLAPAAAAILCNHFSVLAIAEWGASQPPDLLRALGFRKGVSPHQTTIQRLFAKINPDHLSAALSSYFGKITSSAQVRSRGSQGVAIDGKAQRGRLAFDSSGCPVHALSALLHDFGIVLAHEPIESHGQNDKAEAELTVAPALIGRIDWQGRVMTADALLCQRKLSQQVLQAQGDYLLTVKENQRTLHRGNGASVMALLRDLAIGLLRQNGYQAIARRLRYNSRHPSQAVALIIGNAA